MGIKEDHHVNFETGGHYIQHTKEGNSFNIETYGNGKSSAKSTKDIKQNK